MPQCPIYFATGYNIPLARATPPQRPRLADGERMRIVEAEQIGGVILAAGASRRMGRPKALLSFGASTFVGRMVRVLYRAGARPLVAVTREELLDDVKHEVGSRASVVVNPSPERGMESSLWCGLEVLWPRKEVVPVGSSPARERRPIGFVLAMVDQPHVSRFTVKRLLDTFHAHPDRIVIPCSWDGRRGHPVVFPADLVEELRQEHREGARAVVWRHDTRVLEVAVTDTAPFTNVNTPEDLAALLSLVSKSRD